jgi:hypothetical protein
VVAAAVATTVGGAIALLQVGTATARVVRRRFTRTTLLDDEVA